MLQIYLCCLWLSPGHVLLWFKYNYIKYAFKSVIIAQHKNRNALLRVEIAEWKWTVNIRMVHKAHVEWFSHPGSFWGSRRLRRSRRRSARSADPPCDPNTSDTLRCVRRSDPLQPGPRYRYTHTPNTAGPAPRGHRDNPRHTWAALLINQSCHWNMKLRINPR